MTCHFTNGPAANWKPILNRAPLFLRVSVGACGEVWFNNLPDEEPEDDCAVFVYYRKPKSNTYQLHEFQPAEFQIRDNDEWRKWVRSQLGEIEENY